MKKLIYGSFSLQNSNFFVTNFSVTNFLPQFQNWFKKGLYSHLEKGSFTSLKIEPWRAVEAHNGGLEAQNAAVEGQYASGRRFAVL